MRPVEKKNVGVSIALEDGTVVVVKEDYKPHTDARPVLLANLGHYCSYCETWVQVGSNMEVEHVQPKGYIESGVCIYEHLKKQVVEFSFGLSNM